MRMHVQSVVYKAALYQLVPYLTVFNLGLINRSSQSACCHVVIKDCQIPGGGFSVSQESRIPMLSLQISLTIWMCATCLLYFLSLTLYSPPLDRSLIYLY